MCGVPGRGSATHRGLWRTVVSRYGERLSVSVSEDTRAVPQVPSEPASLSRDDGRRLSVVEHLAADLAAASSLDEVVEVVTGRLTQTVGAVGVSLSLMVAPAVLELLGRAGATAVVGLPGRRFAVGMNNPVTEAARTGQVVAVLGRAAVAGAYPDLWTGSAAERSVVAVPLFAAGRCQGVLGLVFDAATVPAADMRVLRTAASVTAQALARMAAQRAERDRDTQLSFLVSATTELAGSLDYELTLQRLADLVVPGVADWCAIDVLADGVLRSIAVAHTDPAKVELALRMRRTYPPDTNAPTGAHVVARTRTPEIYEDVDPALLEAAAHDDEHLRLVRELDLRSAILVPLIAGDRTLGVLTLVRSGDGRRYGQADLQFAQELARRAAVSIDNAQVHTVTVEASLQLQRAVLPVSFAGLPGWQVAFDYRPAGRTAVGGDFYDAVPLPDGRLVAFVGDVMGRGVEAAAAMAQVRSALHAYVALDPDPRTVVERVSVMFETLDMAQLVTVLYAVLDPAAATVDLLSAGHLPPLVIRHDGNVERLVVPSSPPLGAGEHPRTVVTAPLAPGETLLMYTDGLVERRGEDLDTGLDRLEGAAQTLHGDVTNIRLRLIADQLREAGHDDDVTLLAVRSIPSPLPASEA